MLLNRNSNLGLLWKLGYSNNTESWCKMSVLNNLPWNLQMAEHTSPSYYSSSFSSSWSSVILNLRNNSSCGCNCWKWWRTGGKISSSQTLQITWGSFLQQIQSSDAVGNIIVAFDGYSVLFFSPFSWVLGRDWMQDICWEPTIQCTIWVMNGFYDKEVHPGWTIHATSNFTWLAATKLC